MWSVPGDGSTEEGAFSERLGGGKPEPCSCREFIALEFGESGESVFLSSIGPRARDLIGETGL